MQTLAVLAKSLQCKWVHGIVWVHKLAQTKWTSSNRVVSASDIFKTGSFYYYGKSEAFVQVMKSVWGLKNCSASDFSANSTVLFRMDFITENVLYTYNLLCDSIDIVQDIQ